MSRADVAPMQEERVREDARQAALLEERARAEQELRENHAARHIQRILRAFMDAQRAAANAGGKNKQGKKGGGGKKGKKGK